MKVIAGILLSYFTILLVAPVPCAIASFTEEEISCEYTCDQEETCDEVSDCSENECNSDSDCSTSLCCNVQCCHCYFVNEQDIQFNSYSVSTNKHAFPENDKITSAFCGECWQPPEMI